MAKIEREEIALEHLTHCLSWGGAAAPQCVEMRYYLQRLGLLIMVNEYKHIDGCS